MSVILALQVMLNLSSKPYLKSSISAEYRRLLSCSAVTAGSDGSVSVTWTNGEPKVC